MIKEGFFLSVLDSDRFNLNIHRGVVDHLDVEMVRNYIIQNNVDLLVLRIPVETIESHYKLNDIAPWILADTLVYYTCNLATANIKTIKNNLTFVEVNSENSYLMSSLVPIIFGDYKNHYKSNPKLNKKTIIEGYIQWASNHFGHNLYSWLVYKEQNLIGFATCSVDNGEAEGVLYGVHPDFAGGGVYSDIIRFTQAFFSNIGISCMKVSTQIQNYAVQKVWSREGFTLTKAYYTYHINSI